MRKLIHLDQDFQEEIGRKFVIPTVYFHIVVDAYGRPFERISGALVMLPMRSTFVQGAFHVHCMN